MAKICVVGLGYVGLPLTLHLAKHFNNVVGLDTNSKRVNTLNSGYDYNNEYTKEELKGTSAHFVTNENALNSANFIIVIGVGTVTI